MQVRHVINHGVATVDDELAAKLIETELWVKNEARKQPTPKAAATKQS